MAGADVVTVTLDEPSSQLGPYTVGIRLTDAPPLVRIDSNAVMPPLDAETEQWAMLPGYPIQIRRQGPLTYPTIQFRLVQRDPK